MLFQLSRDAFHEAVARRALTVRVPVEDPRAVSVSVADVTVAPAGTGLRSQTNALAMPSRTFRAGSRGCARLGYPELAQASNPERTVCVLNASS